MANGNQTKTGKAFEYSCAYALYQCYDEGSASIVGSPQLNTARNAFATLTEESKENYLKAANAAVKVILRQEPMLHAESPLLLISLQTDSQGISGDVRDVLCVRGGEWEIGLSCKHNHDAVKHSRLSETIDFGRDWFGKSCSYEYFKVMSEVLRPLRILRDETREFGSPALWSGIDDKDKAIYVPVLNAFMDELKRLDSEFPKEIPGLLIQYLLGRNDFYKVIMNESRRYTEIESYNISGTLNKSCDGRKALFDAPVIKLPTKFYEIGFKEGSFNTINIVCDQGWNISMRIHNASSRVEPSLKFDVRLLATPSTILTQIEPWD